MNNSSSKNSSKVARDIILSQIKQDFVTPANAIFDYIDIVEKALTKLDFPSDDELDQIKSLSLIHISEPTRPC